MFFVYIPDMGDLGTQLNRIHIRINWEYICPGFEKGGETPPLQRKFNLYDKMFLHSQMGDLKKRDYNPGA